MRLLLAAALLGTPFVAFAQSPSTGAPAPTPPPGAADSSKIRLDAGDIPGALSDAEQAIARGGGADAYAARGDAKRAAGRPLDEVLEDYARAAQLDPRYSEKYRGLIAQRESQENPDLKKAHRGVGFEGMPIRVIGAAAALGVALTVGGILFSRPRVDKSGV